MCELQQCQPPSRNNQQPLEAVPQTQPPKAVRKSSSMQALTNSILNKEQVSTVASSIQQKSYNQNSPNEGVILGQREQLVKNIKKYLFVKIIILSLPKENLPTFITTIMRSYKHMEKVLVLLQPQTLLLLQRRLNQII